jgi:DNA-binding NtrC family response regulator
MDIQLDLRVVAATSRNLREAVKEGAFRPLFPPQRHSDHDPAAPRENRRHPAPGEVFHRALQSQIQAQYRRLERPCDEPASFLRLAGQRAGTAQRYRTRHDFGRISVDYIIESSDRHLTPRRTRIASECPQARKSAEWASLEDSERSLVARALERTSGNQTQAAQLLRVGGLRAN